MVMGRLLSGRVEFPLYLSKRLISLINQDSDGSSVSVVYIQVRGEKFDQHISKNVNKESS